MTEKASIGWGELEYSRVRQLAEDVRNEASNLSELISFKWSFGFGDDEELSPEATEFISRVGQEKADEVREILSDLSDLLWYKCNPTTVLKLSRSEGLSLLEETNMACATLKVFIPDIPDDVMRRLEIKFMHDIR